MNSKIDLKVTTTSATIINGELTSFKADNQEYIHQKGNKGWRNSDDEMFPIIGPIDKNNFIVHTKSGDAILDQHGLLRELEYTLISSDKNTARFLKKYTANSKIKNSKFPQKSKEEELFWPFGFSFEKNFKLEENILKIEFVIHCQKGMPFMLGYHPAFLLSDSGKETIKSNTIEIPLRDILKAGSNAFPVLETNSLTLKNIDKNDLKISTKGFHNFMLWTEVNNMLCIEPITQYTSYTDQKFSEENMRLSEEKNSFSVEIKIL